MIGFRIKLPFLVLYCVAAPLLSQQVLCVPANVFLPLKLLVFVMADGWSPVVRGLLECCLNTS